MSVANYEANSQHHAQILICVQVVGNLQAEEVEFALAKIKKHERLIVADAGRTVQFRFEVDASSENSKWGFFQVHRRVMGLIILAGCSTAMDVALLHETFQKRRDELQEFIFDVRCFVFGIDNALMAQNKAEVFQFNNVKSWKTSDRDIKQFLTSVFYVLESKRLQMAADKSDRPTLLTAPFEQQGSSSDNEGRSFRKKCSGRWKKHLADICLISGLMMDALQNYHSALDSLIAANDQIWIAGCLEGLCVASAIFLYPEKTAMPRSPVAKNFNKQVLDPRNLLTMKLAGSHSNADIGKFCIQAPNDFVDRYKEAVINYSWHSDMGVVELEACIKATKVMAIINKPMQAAEFLQNAVYISINITDVETIKKYSVLADLYADINFHRKSAFYKRVAAMQCVALKTPNWPQCFDLLQDTLHGYNLNFENDSDLPVIETEQTNNDHGWPNVRLRVLHELVHSSQRISKTYLANRYRLYLLTKMHEILSEYEEREICAALPTSKDDQEGGKIDHILPPINLYKLPIAREVAPQPLSSALTPTLVNQSQGSDSVFLFAPSSYHANRKSKNKIDFQWSINTASEVLIHIHNPLRVHHLNMSDFKLMCEDPEVDFHSITVVIPPCSTVEATMVLVPKTLKPVKIIGYQFTTFGVESFCYFRNMPWLQLSQFEVNVTPEIPVLQKDGAFLSPISNDKRSKLSVPLYPGETKIITIPFSNVSSISITEFEIETVGCKSNNINKQFLAPNTIRKKKEIIKWLHISCDVDNLKKLLPLNTGSFIKVPIKLQVSASDGIQCLLNNNNDDQLHSCQVKIKYSGKIAMESNYGRVSIVRINATLQPGIRVLNIKVQPASRQGWCKVFITLRNCSNELIYISTNTLTQENLPQFTENHVMKKKNSIEIKTINSQDDKVVTFLLPTFDSKILDPPTKTKSLDCNLRTESNISNVQVELQKVLGLNWRIENVGGDDDSNGYVDVSTFKISQESLFNLIQSPIYWTVLVNEIDVTTEQHCTAQIGEPCPVRIELKNHTDIPIPLIDLEMEIYQDQCNGFKEWDMNDRAMCLGCRSQSIKNLQPGEIAEFECSLLFLLVGEYHVRLRRLSPNDDNVCGFWKKDLKKTFSNQSLSDVTSFREFSPKAIIMADFK